MKVTFTEAIEATLVVSARLGPDGDFTAYVAAHCPYAEDELEGATCSAQIAVPRELAAQILDVFEKAKVEVTELLGRELSKARHEAYKESVRLREIAP